MTEAQHEAVATTIGALLDEIAKRPDEAGEYLRDLVSDLGRFVFDSGGAAMARVFQLVIGEDADAESRREAALDKLWSGIGPWLA